MNDRCLLHYLIYSSHTSYFAFFPSCNKTFLSISHAHNRSFSTSPYIYFLFRTHFQLDYFTATSQHSSINSHTYGRVSPVPAAALQPPNRVTYRFGGGVGWGRLVTNNTPAHTCILNAAVPMIRVIIW